MVLLAAVAGEAWMPIKSQNGKSSLGWHLITLTFHETWPDVILREQEIEAEAGLDALTDRGWSKTKDPRIVWASN